MKNPIIRTIYLYLFALVGLIMATVGTAQLVNLGLKVWVFTRADVVADYSLPRVPEPALAPAKANVEAIKSCSTECEFTAEQKQQIDQWLKDYQAWQVQQSQQPKIDYVQSNRQREAAQSLGLIIVGLPLYLYHWLVIKRDRRQDQT